MPAPSTTFAAPTPMMTGAMASGRVRRRAPAIQSDAVAGLTLAFGAIGRPALPLRSWLVLTHHSANCNDTGYAIPDLADTPSAVPSAAPPAASPTSRPKATRSGLPLLRSGRRASDT